MRSLTIKITIAVVLLSLTAPVFYARQASAQGLPVFDASANIIQKVIAGAQVALETFTKATIGPATVSTSAAIGPPGTAAIGISAIRAGLSTTCQAIIAGYDNASAVATTAESVTNTALSVIGGGTGDLVKSSTKLSTASAALACVSNYATALSLVPGATLTLSAELQREQTRFETIAASLRENIQQLSAQQNASAKDITKAFMVKLLLNLNKNLTTRVVNELVNKYKIDDYLAYGDAVATQVYAMKYIDQNFEGDTRTQMMMRSLIQSEKIPQQARVAVNFANQQAKQYVGYACSGVGKLDAQNPASLKCLSSLGQVEASPTYRYLKAVDMAGQVKGEAIKTAQAEIAQSDGYAPPRNCAGSVREQEQLDARIQAAASEAEAAEIVLAQLQEALKSGRTTQAEVDKAQAAYLAADTKLAELPLQVEKPVIDICDAIDSPAKYVSTSVENFLKQHLDQGSQLKSDNLPFYASFLSDLTSNFLTNLLTGGRSSSKILKEGGLQALSIGIGSVVANQSSAVPDSFPTDDTSQDPDERQDTAGEPTTPPPSGGVNGVSTVNFNPRGSAAPSSFRIR
jgi:cell division protein ZapA (FtsZ GTPase activity inhibitor)